MNNEMCVEYSYVDMDTLTQREIATWNMKDVVLKCVGGLPPHIKRLMLAEMLQCREDSIIDGQCILERGEIVISRSVLLRPERFLGVLLHEIAHAISKSGDATRAFENELTNLLGYLAKALVDLSNNDIGRVNVPKKLDTYSVANATCICVSCLGKSFEYNADKTYVKCKTCGREYHGGYLEVVDLNRKYMQEHGIGQWVDDIFHI